jgi:uncharacterized membrane protein
MESNTPNGVLRQQALDTLKGQWGLPIGTFLLYGIVVGVIGAIPLAGPLTSLIITGPFSLGLAIFSLSVSRKTNPQLEQIFQGFNNFTNALVAYLLMVLYILLWSLLLIIPGIIAALSYAMVFFIIADEPAIKPADALRKSKAMMEGNKTKLFLMILVFMLLAIACVFTLFIGFLWLSPFMQVTMAKFYDDIKDNSAPADATTISA